MTTKTAPLLVLLALLALLAGCASDGSLDMLPLPDEVVLVVWDPNGFEYMIVYTDVEFFSGSAAAIEVVGTRRELDTIGFQIYGFYDACEIRDVFVFPASFQPPELVCVDMSDDFRGDKCDVR